MRIAIAPAILMIRRCLAILGVNSDRLRYKVFPELDWEPRPSRTNKLRSANSLPRRGAANTMREFKQPEKRLTFAISESSC
jgi:hypothetical protein